MGLACKKLTATDVPIKEICFDCGFQNFVSFHKIFKTVTNVTPSAYRSKAISHFP
ncbi:MAG: helix-turn-helix domain-containing protein [Sphingobacterium sp.]|uniref:helix-turn-helix domain-containing protein n=1 Tax=Sphingobacterium sp. JB170 TaxID=1434842 RepID=UPI000B34C008